MAIGQHLFPQNDAPALDIAPVQQPITLRDGRLNAFDLAAPVALYCGANGTLEVYDIGTDGQRRLAFSLPLTDLLNGTVGTELGSRLALNNAGEAELFALELLSPFPYRFDPIVCMAH
jgi:hypothetical protein